MSRTLVALREAHVGDASFLVGLWQDSIRPADTQEQIADLELVIKGAAESPEQRLLVAEYDGERAGAVYLRATTFGPLNLEPTVQAFSPHVVDCFQRRGVGHALMEAAVTFAEELGIGHVASAAPSGSRDGNRFLARLGLGPQGVIRLAPTVTIRGRLDAARPSGRARGSRSHLGQVLAARRSMRRSQPAG
ncbi:GNAT family N-acetyltransferase [Nocardioides sp. DS6]|uniref:GNAT family N-acetyltransferase n=1 Tax=Nocardioides eburneus TaxID=3231482 RepID=A0ABV3SZT6_9ACTN